MAELTEGELGILRNYRGNASRRFLEKGTATMKLRQARSIGDWLVLNRHFLDGVGVGDWNETIASRKGGKIRKRLAICEEWGTFMVGGLPLQHR